MQLHQQSLCFFDLKESQTVRKQRINLRGYYLRCDLDLNSTPKAWQALFVQVNLGLDLVGEEEEEEELSVAAFLFTLVSSLSVLK